MSDDNKKASNELLAGLKSILIIAVLAIAVSWAGSDGGLSYAGWPIFAICALLAFVVQWLVFIPAYLYQTERYFDLTGSITYLTVVVIAMVLSDASEPRQFLLAAMVAIWAGRLGSFLFIRISKDGGDQRFDAIKPRFWRFLRTWNLQGLWVVLTLACGLAAITQPEQKPLGIIAHIGAALWLLGFLFEAIADYQKRVFKRDPANKGRFITSGLWAWSRHPNYFGEITLWMGVALVALPVLQGWQYVTLISPVFVLLLLTRVSGVPLLEARADKEWGGEPEYEAYKARTPELLPKPPKG